MRWVGLTARVGALLAILGCASLLDLMPQSAWARPAGGGAQTLTGVDAVRSLVARKEFDKARKFGYAQVWSDLDQPEAMFLLGRALEGLGTNDEAATIYVLLLRTLDGKPDPGGYRVQAGARLKVLDAGYERQKAAFIAGASGKKFDSPQAVDDGWMLAVRCDLFTPYLLGCWTLVGPRGGVPADWIHNREGRLHRSGAKFVPEVDGRKGLLYTQSIKDKPHPEKYEGEAFHVKNLARLGGHPPQLTLTNIGDCRYLRVGIKAEGRFFELRVYVDGKRVLNQQISGSKWSDLQVDLPRATVGANRPADSGGAVSRPNHQKVILELVCPEDPPGGGPVWIDYADFFVN